MKTEKIIEKEFTSVTNVLQVVYVCDICGKEHIVEKVKPKVFIDTTIGLPPDIAPPPITTICQTTSY